MAVLTHNEALDRLERNNVRVDILKEKESDAVIAKIIKVVRPVGLKVLTAIDCLVNYHGYRKA